MYINREIEMKLESYLRQFKVVLVTGARQTGKTTMLRHCLPKSYEYTTLDDLNELDLAVSDPKAFLNAGRIPIIVDEVQQVPDLSRQTKLVVDALDEYGAVVLAGSQTYELMQGVGESLAGRIGILELSGLSLREILGRNSAKPYVPEQLSKRNLDVPQALDLWAHIQRGSMPRLQVREVDWYDYFASYTKSYLERDVRQLVNLKDEHKFHRSDVGAHVRDLRCLRGAEELRQRGA